MTGEQKTEKANEYAAIILLHLQEAFNPDSGSQINIEDFKDDLNFKCFVHAISNLVPNSIFASISGDRKDSLEFNHIANHLCFEFGHIVPNK